MRRAALAALVAGALAASPAAAGGDPIAVEVQFQAFSPGAVDVLPGETVEWANVSERRHTVTADDGSFDSGDLFGGDHFSQTFDSVGAHPYHCTVHAVMTGEVDVRRVTLGPLPTALVPSGDSIDVDGRSADPSSDVQIQRDTGDGFETVATATPSPDGSWSTKVVAEKTGDYRAAVGSDVSETRHLLVSERHVLIRPTRTGLAVTVQPSDPYARVALQLDLRERFGWWQAQQGRLDYVSQTGFRVHWPARARVVLLDKDGWTPLAISPILVVGRRPPRR